MTRGEPITVRLYRCDSCHRIYGQEIGADEDKLYPEPEDKMTIPTDYEEEEA